MGVTKTACRERATEQALDIWAKRLLTRLITIRTFSFYRILTPEF